MKPAVHIASEKIISALPETIASRVKMPVVQTHTLVSNILSLRVRTQRTTTHLLLERVQTHSTASLLEPTGVHTHRVSSNLLRMKSNVEVAGVCTTAITNNAVFIKNKITIM